MNNYYKIYLARCVIAMKGWSREAGEGGGGGGEGGGGEEGETMACTISKI